MIDQVRFVVPAVGRPKLILRIAIHRKIFAHGTDCSIISCHSFPTPKKQLYSRQNDII